jgi:hypothetical protein
MMKIGLVERLSSQVHLANTSLTYPIAKFEIQVNECSGEGDCNLLSAVPPLAIVFSFPYK